MGTRLICRGDADGAEIGGIDRGITFADFRNCRDELRRLNGKVTQHPDDGAGDTVSTQTLRTRCRNWVMNNVGNNGNATTPPTEAATTAPAADPSAPAADPSAGTGDQGNGNGDQGNGQGNGGR